MLRIGRDGLFPFLAKAAPIALYGRVALVGPQRRRRAYWRPGETELGRIAAVPMKATHSARAALDVLRLLLRRSRERGLASARQTVDLLGPAAQSGVVPSRFRFTDAAPPDPADVRHYAELLALCEPERRGMDGDRSHRRARS